MSTIKVNEVQPTVAGGGVKIDGQQMPTAGPLSNRNVVINGAMNVWQRGTSQTVSGGYGADRFWMAFATSATRNTSAPAGFTYSTKLTYGSQDMAIGQPIELTSTGVQDGALASGNTVTLSYYARVDSGTEAIGTAIFFRDSKFVATNQVAFTSSNSNATWTTTWTRYEHQFTVPTVAGTNIIAGLEINGISKDAYVTGVQLEVGEKATPFEHRNYGDELVRCQRYFQKHREPRLRGVGGGATHCNRMGMTLPVTMRIAPAVTSTGAFAWYDGSNIGTINTFTVSYPFPTSIELDSSNSTSNPNAMTGTTTATNPIVLYNSNGVYSGEVLIDAEL